MVSRRKAIASAFRHLKDRKILIAPGHVGYKGIGAVSLGIGYSNPDSSRTGTLLSRNYNEEQLDTYIAHQVLLLLEHAGADADICVGPFAHKACRAEQFKPEAFIEIHCNSVGGNPQPNGIEIWHDHKDNPSILLAVQILASMVCATGLASRGLKDMDSEGNEHDERDAHDALFECMPRQERAFPLVLIECGFLSNEVDAEFLTNFDNHEKIATAICHGADCFFESRSEGFGDWWWQPIGRG